MPLPVKSQRMTSPASGRPRALVGGLGADNRQPDRRRARPNGAGLELLVLLGIHMLRASTLFGPAGSRHSQSALASGIDFRMKKKSECETAIRHLCHEWARSHGIPSKPDFQPSFADFKSWLREKGYL